MQEDRIHSKKEEDGIECDSAQDRMTSDECPVCFEVLASRIRIVTPCAHVICLECLWKLHPQLCPLCRIDMTHLYPRTNVHAQAKNHDMSPRRRHMDETVAAGTSAIMNRMNEIFPDIASAWEAVADTTEDDGRSLWRLMSSRYTTSGDTFLQIVHTQESDTEAPA